MFSTVFALFIFTGYTVTADLQFATREQCEAVRTQIQQPRVAFKAQCVEIQVPVKTLECDVENFAFHSEETNRKNVYAHYFPAIGKIKCREVK